MSTTELQVLAGSCQYQYNSLRISLVQKSFSLVLMFTALLALNCCSLSLRGGSYVNDLVFYGFLIFSMISSLSSNKVCIVTLYIAFLVLVVHASLLVTIQISFPHDLNCSDGQLCTQHKHSFSYMSLSFESCLKFSPFPKLCLLPSSLASEFPTSHNR